MYQRVRICEFCIFFFCQLSEEKILEFYNIYFICQRNIYHRREFLFWNKSEIYSLSLDIYDRKSSQRSIRIKCTSYMYARIINIYRCRWARIILYENIDSCEQKERNRHHIKSLKYTIYNQRKYQYTSSNIPRKRVVFVR